MPIAVCLIGATSEREYAGCRASLRKAWIEQRLDVNLKIMRVPCEMQTPGWSGCWECHRLAARMALTNNWPVYLFLESKARPSLRFHWGVVLRVATYLENHPEKLLVNLSILPWPFKGAPRKKLTSDIYENASAQMNGTTALLCTSLFAKRILSMPPTVPIVLQLAESGVSTLITYPAPFQRNGEASTTTAPLFCGKYLRSPRGYLCTEEIDARPILMLFISICLFVSLLAGTIGCSRYAIRAALRLTAT